MYIPMLPEPVKSQKHGLRPNMGLYLPILLMGGQPLCGRDLGYLLMSGKLHIPFGCNMNISSCSP